LDAANADSGLARILDPIVIAIAEDKAADPRLLLGE
jgi:hypothetical protein